jgi:excisionase family DNA binding protein
MADTARLYEADRSESRDRLLTISEVADRLAVSRATVYRLLADGALHPIRVRSHLRIAERDVRDLIDQRRPA